MKYELKYASTLAREIGVPAPVLSPEEIKAKYREFMNTALAAAKNATSEYFRKYYLKGAAALALKSGLPARALSPER